MKLNELREVGDRDASGVVEASVYVHRKLSHLPNSTLLREVHLASQLDSLT